jgi:hypothetical protein
MDKNYNYQIFFYREIQEDRQKVQGMNESNCDHEEDGVDKCADHVGGHNGQHWNAHNCWGGSLQNWNANGSKGILCEMTTLFAQLDDVYDGICVK